MLFPNKYKLSVFIQFISYSSIYHLPVGAICIDLYLFNPVSLCKSSGLSWSVYCSIKDPLRLPRCRSPLF